MGNIRVLAVIHHDALRSVLADLLSETPGLDLVGESGEEDGILDLIRDLRPDLLLLDLSSPTGGIIRALQAIREAVPEVKIIVLSDFDLEVYREMVASVGADGYVLKLAMASDLIPEIQRVFPEGCSEAIGG